MPYILYIYTYSWILDRRFTPKLEELDLAHSSVLGDVKVFETGSNWRAVRGQKKQQKCVGLSSNHAGLTMFNHQHMA
jgi:hypothetical protein